MLMPAQIIKPTDTKMTNIVNKWQIVYEVTNSHLGNFKYWWSQWVDATLSSEPTFIETKAKSAG